MPINSFLYPGAKVTTGYNVANSLRFNDDDSAYLNITPSSASNRKTWTWSSWVKLGTVSGDKGVFSASSDDSNRNSINVVDEGYIIFDYEVSGTRYLVSTQDAVYRDPSAWFHIVVAVDTTQSTSTNRVKIYVNGSQVTLTTILNGYPSQNADMFINNDVAHSIGKQTWGSAYYDGYIAEAVLIDGSALTPSSFGEYDEDSPTIWKPKNVSGLTFGTNGFYLEFKQSGTSQNSSGLGADTSGNDNHFASNNLAATDQSTDTCTNNFLTWNPLDGTDLGDLTFSEGNLKVVNGTGVCRGTLAASSGKWYWEIKQISTVNASYPIQYGIADTEDSPPTHSSLNNALIAYSDNALNKAIKKFAAGTASTVTSTMGSFNNIAQNDIIQFAFDADTAKLWVGRNGTYLNSGDPANGTGEVASTNAGNFFTPCLEHAGATYTIESNFGSPPYSISSGNTDANGHGNFEYAVPSGFFAWNTKNLAEHG